MVWQKKNLEKSPIAKGAQNDWKKPMTPSKTWNLMFHHCALWFDRKKNLEKSPIAKGDQNDWKKPMNDFHQRGRNGKSERKQEKPHWQEKWVGWLTKKVNIFSIWVRLTWVRSLGWC